MADTPISNQIAQTATDVSTAAGNAGSKGFSQGIQLAQAADDMQQKQVQTEKMKDDLDMGKANSLLQRMSTQNRIGDDRLRQTYAKQNEDWARKNGLAYPGFFTDQAGQDAQHRNGALTSLASGTINTPEGARAALAATSGPAEFDQGMQILAERQKQQNQLAMEHEKSRTSLAQAAIVGGYKVQTAQVSGGYKQQNADIRGANMYKSTMEKSDNALIAANKVQKIIKEVDEGTLNSNKTIKGEVQKNIAQLLSNGAPSTVYGESAINQDSYYEELQNLYNKTLGKADGVVAPEQWEQMKKDVTALQSNASENHELKYKSLRAEFEGTPIQEHMDNRYNVFRKGLGLGGLGDKQAATPAGTPAPQTDTFRSFMDLASKQPGFDYQKATAAFQKLHPQGK